MSMHYVQSFELASASTICFIATCSTYNAFYSATCKVKKRNEASTSIFLHLEICIYGQLIRDFLTSLGGLGSIFKPVRRRVRDANFFFFELFSPQENE